MADYVTITNTTRQMISLQVRQPGSDFYLGEKQVRLLPRKSVVVPKSHLMESQIENLRAKNQIKVS